MKPLTAHMKTTLLDLYTVVLDYDNGVPLHPHDVKDVHHKILRGLDSRKLILLEASNSPTGIIWTVALTVKGLREAKKLSKDKQGINATDSKPNRKRITIQWQVDMLKSEGRQTYEDAMAMKADKKQSFTKTMNQLIQLHKELKAGQVGLLQTLYPEAYSTMLLIAQTEIEMEREGELRGIIAEFKRLMVSQSSATPHTGGLKPVQPSTQGNAPKVLHTRQIEAPTFDDEDLDEGLLEVKVDSGAAMRSTQNFLRSMTALQDSKPTTDSRALSPRQRANLDKG